MFTEAEVAMAPVRNGGAEGTTGGPSESCRRALAAVLSASACLIPPPKNLPGLPWEVYPARDTWGTSLKGMIHRNVKASAQHWTHSNYAVSLPCFSYSLW